MGISPQAFPGFSCVLLQPFKHRISRRILPIPPAPALLDEFLIEVHPIGQDHIPKDAFVLVVAVGLDGDFFPKGKLKGSVLGVFAIGLTFFGTVDAVKTDAVSMVAVQYFESVAVEDAHDMAGEVGGVNRGRPE